MLKFLRSFFPSSSAASDDVMTIIRTNNGHFITTKVALNVYLYRQGVPVELRVIIARFLYAILKSASIRTAVEQWCDHSNPHQKRLAFNLYGHISEWDTSKVTSMTRLFAWKDFNEDIHNWNVSQVQDMSFMFWDARQFNQPLDSWDVKKVRNMSGMLKGAISFNQSLAHWDVSSVTSMYGLFHNCRNFNQSLNEWDVSKVTNMAHMFRGAMNFNQPLDLWHIDHVTDMRLMFYDAKQFNQPLNTWNLRNVTDKTDMFTASGIDNIL